MTASSAFDEAEGVKNTPNFFEGDVGLHSASQDSRDSFFATPHGVETSTGGLLEELSSRDCDRPANDCRISCNAASYGDADRGALFAPTREWHRRKRAAAERGLLEPAARPAGKQAPRCQLLAVVRRRGVSPSQSLPALPILAIIWLDAA